MLRIGSRLRYHTPDDAAGYLTGALDVLDAAGDRLTPDERAAALPVLVTLLSQQHVEVEHVAVGAPHMAIPGQNHH